MNVLKRLLDGQPQSAGEAVAELEARQARVRERLAANAAERRALALKAEAGDEDAAARLRDLAMERSAARGDLDRISLALEDARDRLAAEQVGAVADTRAARVAHLRSLLKDRTELAAQVDTALTQISENVSAMESLGAEIVAAHRELIGRPDLDRSWIGPDKLWRRICLHINGSALAAHVRALDVPPGFEGAIPFRDSEAAVAEYFDVPDNAEVPDDWQSKLDWPNLFQFL